MKGSKNTEPALKLYSSEYKFLSYSCSYDWQRHLKGLRNYKFHSNTEKVTSKYVRQNSRPTFTGSS